MEIKPVNESSILPRCSSHMVDIENMDRWRNDEGRMLTSRSVTILIARRSYLEKFHRVCSYKYEAPRPRYSYSPKLKSASLNVSGLSGRV